MELPDFDIEDTERCEEQVKLMVITLTLERAGWPKNQLRIGYVTQGRIMVDKFHSRRDKRVRKLDYPLISKGRKGLVVVEAKKESYPDNHGIQQAIAYSHCWIFRSPTVPAATDSPNRT